VGLFKIGKEAFTRWGPRLVEMVREKGSEVFLDLKYHDIPNTVARAAEAATDLGVFMFNVHALGGCDMMRGAADAVKKRAAVTGSHRPHVLAVTILTSLTNDDLDQLGMRKSVAELVPHLASLAKQAGLDGVVCSPREITAVRKVCGEDMIIVTPGVRGGQEIQGDDQKRTLSCREAIAAGADYVVIGRPIRMAHNPVQAAEMLVAEIRDGLAMRAD